MLTQRSFVSTFSVAVVMLGTHSALGQEYPTRTIRIFTASAGASGDVMARELAQNIAGPLGQSVVVENRPGIIADETVAKAEPDGYTLLVHGTAMWIMPLLQKTNYDPVADFAPVSLLQTLPMLIVVHPSLPVKSIRDLIALAKAKPGMLNYGTGSIGGTGHLGAELLKALAGINIVQVNYKSTDAFLAATISGEVQMTVISPQTAAPQIASGRLRALAVTTAQPSPLVPGLPTVAASGPLPGYDVEERTGLFAPARTPTAIINRLNQEVVRVLRQPAEREKFAKLGVEVIGSSPEEMVAKMKADITDLGKVIKSAGIRTP